MKKSHKKILINISIIAIIAITAAGYYFLKALPEQKKAAKKGVHNLIEGVNKKDIIGIEIIYHDTGQVYKSLINMVSNKWQIIFPVRHLADTAHVDKMLDDLLKMKSEDILKNIPLEKFSDYGFDKPSDVIRLGLKNGKTIEIINGRLATTENYYYTMVNGDSNNIYVVYAHLFSSSEKKADEFADKEIFQYLPSRYVEKLEVKASNNVRFDFDTTVTEKGTQWFMNKPLTIPVDRFEVIRRIMQFYTIRYSYYSYYNDVPSLEKKLGLKNPKYSIKMSSKNGESVSLIISAITNGDYYYAKASTVPGIIMIHGSDISDKFKFTADTFRNKPVINSTNRQ